MYSDEDLDEAVAAGALSQDAARSFREFVSRRRASPVVDEEHFRLVTGFNDIFVTIAAALVLVALAWLGSETGSPLAAPLVAAASWALSEYFTRRRRMALPSIVLLVSFVGAVLVATLSLAGVKPADIQDAGFRVAGCAAVTAFAAFLHWRRFKVPITVAAGTLTALATLLALLFAQFRPGEDVLMSLLLAGGLGVFAFAVAWDASDRGRTTRRSDVAFWLHLAAAPLIVHPAFSLLGLLEGGGDTSRAAIAMGIYVLLALVALAVDRRALLISALAYVLYAMTQLLREAGAVNETFAVTALVIGSALLLLSAAWHSARAVVVGRLPGGLQERLPQL